MFGVVVRASSDPVALAATLSPLVRGVIEGLVRSVWIVTEAAREDDREIADAAGCRLLVEPAGWARGFARAVTNSGGAPLLVLESGVLLGPEFWAVLGERRPVLGNRPGRVPPEGDDGAVARVASALRRAGGAGLRPDTALILPPPLAREIAQAGGDPWRWRYGSSLQVLPVRTRRLNG